MNGSQAVLLRDLIDLSLLMQAPKELVRIHESGDFWTENYMRAWIMVAQGRPQQRFYAYTKSLGMWLTLKDIIPPNFYLTASQGGTLDYLIPKYPEVFQRIAYVVYTEEEAQERGLSIDHDDSHCLGDKPFALLVHGSQRAGSDAMKALTQRKKEGKFVGYGKSRKVIICKPLADQVKSDSMHPSFTDPMSLRHCYVGGGVHHMPSLPTVKPIQV
jgi:hypothetical protein